MKKTPWFPASAMPIREGEYEVHRFFVGGFPARTRLLWKDGSWRHTEHSSDGLWVGSGAAMSSKDGDKWRGLAEKPA
jgi:hypothetical protein